MGFHGALVWREKSQQTVERKPAVSGPGLAGGGQQYIWPCRASIATEAAGKGAANPPVPACFHTGNFSFLDVDAEV